MRRRVYFKRFIRVWKSKFNHENKKRTLQKLGGLSIIGWKDEGLIGFCYRDNPKRRWIHSSLEQYIHSIQDDLCHVIRSSYSFEFSDICLLYAINALPSPCETSISEHTDVGYIIRYFVRLS